MTRELAAYVRVSRKGERDFDQTLTQDIQLSAMRKWVERNSDKYRLHAHVFDGDLDRPAPDFDPVKRPDYARARAWVMEKPTQRGLIVYNASRFGRNDWSIIETKEYFRAGALLVISDTGATSDLNKTSTGSFQLSIEFGLATMQRAKIGEDWKAALRVRASRGLHHGKVPIGYRRVPTVKDEHGRKNDDAGQLVFSDNHKAVAQIFTDYANGVSIRQLSKRLAELRGVDTVEPSTVKHMMKNEVFIGKIRRKGEFIDGAHKALVEADVWAAVQRRNRQETKQPSQLAEPRSFLAGVMRCAVCKGSVVIVNQTNRGTFVSCRNNRAIPAGAANRCAGFGTPSLGRIETDFIEICGQMPSEEHLHSHEGQDQRTVLTDRLSAAQNEHDKALSGRDRLSVQYAKGNLSDAAFEAAIGALETEVVQTSGLIKRLEEDLLLLPSEPVDRQDASRRIIDAIEDRSAAEARHIIRQELETFGIVRIERGRWGYFPKWVDR